MKENTSPQELSVVCRCISVETLFRVCVFKCLIIIILGLKISFDPSECIGGSAPRFLTFRPSAAPSWLGVPLRHTSPSVPAVQMCHMSQTELRFQNVNH